MISVHGSVYDITDFLPMHPGGTLIAQASGGLDASNTFDDVAHTSNPEVMSLLSKYFVGHLATKPAYRSVEISALYDLWYDYLRHCVEALTTLFFEVKSLMSDSDTWFQGGLLNMKGVRKIYQFQSRLIQNGFSTLFGSKLQELHLKLTFSVANGSNPNVKVPDVIGIITRAQASSAAAATSNEIAQLGKLVCNSQSAQIQEHGIIRYARAATELDARFLEEVRGDICQGMDSFDVVDRMASINEKHRLISLSNYLLSILNRVAQRMETYYTRLAKETIYRPTTEKNPAKARWNLLKRKVNDGSFFVLAQDITFNESSMRRMLCRHRQHDQDVGFVQVIAEATQAINDVADSHAQRPPSARRLADAHTVRAAQSNKAQSSFEAYESRKAVNRMSTFMSVNTTAIKRLSQMPTDRSFEHLMAAYGKTGQNVALPAAMPSATRNASHVAARTSSTSSRPFADPQGEPLKETSQLHRRPAAPSAPSAPIGLPSNPRESVHSNGTLARARSAQAPITTNAAASTSAPLQLTRRGRSRSRARSETSSAANLKLRHIVEAEIPPLPRAPQLTPAVQPLLIRRKISISSHRSQAPSQQSRNNSRSSEPAPSGLIRQEHGEHEDAAAAMLAQMQRQNDVVLRAQAQTRTRGRQPDGSVDSTRSLKTRQLPSLPAFGAATSGYGGSLELGLHSPVLMPPLNVG